MRKLIVLLFIATLKVSIFAQLCNNDTIYTDAAAVVSISIKDSIPLGEFISIDNHRSYAVYKISVDSVYFIRVCEDFAPIFNEEYLLSCIYLRVPFEKHDGTKLKNDWNTHEKHTVRVAVGRGKKDLTFYGIIPKGIYISRSLITICSFSMDCPEDDEECNKGDNFFFDIIKGGE